LSFLGWRWPDREPRDDQTQKNALKNRILDPSIRVYVKFVPAGRALPWPNLPVDNLVEGE
jgi:hypothetical protein